MGDYDCFATKHRPQHAPSECGRHYESRDQSAFAGWFPGRCTPNISMNAGAPLL